MAESSLSEIKREAASHFQSFLNEPSPVSPTVNSVDLSELIDYRCSSADAAILMKPVEEKRVLKFYSLCLPTRRQSLTGSQWSSIRQFGK